MPHEQYDRELPFALLLAARRQQQPQLRPDTTKCQRAALADVYQGKQPLNIRSGKIGQSHA